MKKNIIIILLLISLCISVFVILKGDKRWYINFTNANTRETYNTFHQISDAHSLSTGKGIKIGIIDHYFGFKSNKYIYVNGINFTDNNESFNSIAEHGLWMAKTLKEIAPDVEIYALNSLQNNNPEKESQFIIDAIDWAIENNLDILTYSSKPFNDMYRDKIDIAAKKAISHGIVLCFIHYNLEENILPGIFINENQYSRNVDIRIFQYDYNLILFENFDKYNNKKQKSKTIWDSPYLSYSSMAPVTAGIIAMMMEIEEDLTPNQYKDILIETSKSIEYNNNTICKVVDAKYAIEYMINRKKNKKE